VLRRGTVEIFALAASGIQTRVAELDAPAFFGEMSLLTGEPRSATVRAKSDTALLVVEREGFDSLFKARPSIAEAISRILATRRSELQERRAEAAPAESDESRSRRLLARMKTIFRF
jgi:CRP-like cAMP-binding protein